MNQDKAEDVVLLVDVANVVGSRPDGWWRDRPAAASRLLESLADLRGTTALRPGGQDAVRLSAVVAVVEGAARSAAAPAGVALVRAAQDGDTDVVCHARRIHADGNVPLVVTADRGPARALTYRIPACRTGLAQSADRSVAAGPTEASTPAVDRYVPWSCLRGAA